MLCTLIGAIILSINIRVGLDMHLYDDIGNASSSFRRSTSSFRIEILAIIDEFKGARLIFGVYRLVLKVHVQFYGPR